MKRIMMFCLLIAATSSMIWAQKGLKSVGGGALWNSDCDEWHSLALFANFQYNFTDHIRVSATLGYNIPIVYSPEYYNTYGTTSYYSRWFENAWFSGLFGSAEGHFIIGAPSNLIRPFGIIGIGVGQYQYIDVTNRYTSIVNGIESYVTEYGKKKSLAIAGLAGLGCDFRLTYNLTLQFEGKVHIGPYKKCDSWFVIDAGLGLIYSF